MYETLWKRLLSPISLRQNNFQNMYLFCKPKLLSVYKADPALEVPQQFTEKHNLWLLVVLLVLDFFLVC